MQRKPWRRHTARNGARLMVSATGTSLPVGRAAPAMTSAHVGFFHGNSGMARRMRQVDWAVTEFGAPEQWSHAMRTALGLCLGSHLSSCIYWGPQHLLLYNDAFASLIGTKHPAALLQPAEVVWPEVFEVMQPLLRATLYGGESSGTDDAPNFINRRGYLEEFYCTYSYAPIINEHDVIEAVFVTVPETSTRVIAERRLHTLQRLGLSTRRARRSEETLRVAAEVIAENSYDVPFAALYLCDEDGEQAQLCAVANIDADQPLSPSLLRAGSACALAHFVTREPRPLLQFLDVTPAMQPLPLGAWRIPALQLAVLSLVSPDTRAPRAVVVAGVSPHKRLDDDHITFFRMLADQIMRALGEAFAHQQEDDRIKALQTRARLAQQEERLRIARDLHDTLLQSVQGMQFMLEAGLDKVRAGDPAAADLFTRALAASGHAVAEGREVLSLLRSSSHGVYELSARLDNLCAELTTETDARCVVEIEGAERNVNPSVASEIHVICREAGLNAVRHAQARMIRIAVLFGDELVIEISDDGTGIREEFMNSGRPGHYGIRGMRERAATIGARLQMQRRESGGTAVRLTLPGSSAYLE